MATVSNLKLELQIRLAMLEAHQAQGRAAHQMQKITVGLWRDKIGHVLIGGHDGRPATEDEVLRGEVEVVAAHIHRAESLIDYTKELLGKME